MPNRWKREEQKRRAEARRGLTPEQIAELDRQEAEREKLESDFRYYHSTIFSEEYNFMYEEAIDKHLRSTNGHPYREEYLEEVARKRARFGVDPYDPTQEGFHKSSMDLIWQALREGRYSELDRWVAEVEGTVTDP